ncbi:hypothetical protein SRABI134_00202 [Peribacillus sp. Bi134]|nr:hypothetical protein SRABI134_00202 [Peribacillus sp. Bi134]
MEPQWVQKYKPVKKTKSVHHYLKKIKKNWLFLVKCGSTILASLANFLLYREFTYLIPSLLP